MTDPSAELLMRETRWLAGLARGLLHQNDLADDIAQDTWTVALAQKSTPPRSYLARVARNLAISLLRRESRRSTLEQRAIERSASCAPATDELAAQAELQRAAVNALMELDEPYRRTLLLRFMRGMSLPEIGREMQVPLETVRSRQRRALAQLRSKLDSRPGGYLSLVLPLATFGSRYPTTAALFGLWIMKTKLGIACAALALFGVLFVSFDEGGDLDRGPETGGDPAALVGTVHPSDEPAPREVLADPSAEQRPPVDSTPETGASTRGALRVRVVWEHDGTPAPGIVICLERDSLTPAANPDDHSMRMGRTDDQGIVRYANVPIGEAMIRIAPANIGETEVVAGEEATLEMRTPRGSPVDGVVFDPRGNPVAGAEVLLGLGSLDVDWPTVACTTDAGGRFHMDHVFEHQSLGARSRRLGVSQFVFFDDLLRDDLGTRSANLVLPGKVCTILGQIVDPRGDPIVGAWVDVGLTHSGRFDGEGRQAGLLLMDPPADHHITDSEGRFTARWVRPGRRQIHIRAPGFAPRTATVKCTSDHPTRRVLHLNRGATLHGRVVDGNDAPIAAALVYAVGIGIDCVDDTVADDQGEFVFEHLAQGTFTVSARDAGRAIGKASSEAELRVGKTTRLDLTLQPGARILGRLVDDDDKPLADWWIDQKEGRLRGKTNAVGEFVLTNCGDEAVQIRFRPRFRRCSYYIVDDVVGAEHRRAFRIPRSSMASATISGLILDASGRPMAGAMINVAQQPGHHVAAILRTDANGRFATEALRPGLYSVVSWSGVLHNVSEEVTLIRDQKLVVPTVRLQSKGR